MWLYVFFLGLIGLGIISWIYLVILLFIRVYKRLKEGALKE
jgi:hypothetical protein